MNERGWIAPRIQRKDLEGPLFAEWRLRAWMRIHEAADWNTGEVLKAGRELALLNGASRSTFERWLVELENEGYLRRSRVGEAVREGRVLVVAAIADRESLWDNARDKDGTNDGTIRGTKKSSNGNGKSHASGTKSGTNDGTKAGQSVGHVLSKEKEEVSITVPSEPCAGGEQDLFGGQPPAPPPAPSEPEPEKPAVVARRVVSLFHDLSKAHGGNGVSGTIWGAQQKMAETALNNGLSEEQATEALRWGWREEYQRTRLRAHGMKVLMDVWSAWVEHTGGANGRNGNGRNGTGGASGNGAAVETGTGTVYLNNGRWERR